MLNESFQAIILKGVGIERYETLGGMLNPDVLLDEVDRILAAPYDLLYLVLLACNSHESILGKIVCLRGSEVRNLAKGRGRGL